jgi:hypothetical protein
VRFCSVVQLGDKTATGTERQLACRRSNGLGPKIVVADADGTGEIPLSAGEGSYDSEPAFSHGGARSPSPATATATSTSRTPTAGANHSG